MKVPLPGSGLKYHSSGSGHADSHPASRMAGVDIAMSAAPADRARARRKRVPGRRQTQAAATIAGPMMFRMSTLSRPAGVREPPERVGLEAEQKRVEKNLPAATFDEPGRLNRRAAPAHLRSGAQRDGDTGHEQEGWRRHAAQHHQPAVRGAGLLVRQGPRVEGVRLDHHEHGEAPQPVQIPETAVAGVALTGSGGRVDARRGVERDVLTHRVPDRTIFFARELHGAVELRRVDVAAHGEMQLDADERGEGRDRPDAPTA